VSDVKGDPYTAMAAADAAITKSGSANVELALMGVPQVRNESNTSLTKATRAKRTQNEQNKSKDE
jgi:lipid A disaccharide synthetase